MDSNTSLTAKTCQKESHFQMKLTNKFSYITCSCIALKKIWENIKENLRNIFSDILQDK